jgi:hypothetical protein
VFAAAAILAMTAPLAVAEAKYKADVPDNILTPDMVDTKALGTLNYFDGMPSKETVDKVGDFMVLTRGVEAYMRGIPATSMWGKLAGLRIAGIKPNIYGILSS